MVIASPFKVTDRIINLAHTLDTRVQAVARDYALVWALLPFPIL